MNAHTPGPWTWEDRPSAGLEVRGPYKDSTRLLFCEIWRKFPEPEWDATMKKNIQLAAAAPELLEALKSAVAYADAMHRAQAHIDGADVDYETFPEWRAAIAKAEGEAP